MENTSTSGNWRMGNQRLHRKQVWRDSGMLRFEQETYSKFQLNVPYAILMRKNRAKLLQQAKDEHWSLSKYKQAVMWEYENRGINTTNPGSLEAYAMLRWFEQEWKNTAPDDQVAKWVSPSSKSKSHHGSVIDHNKLLRQKQDYNSRPEVKLARAKYRREHREQIAESRRKLKNFKRGYST